MALRKISLHIRKTTSSFVSIQYLFPEFLHFTIRFKDGGCLKGRGEWGHARDRTSSISFKYKYLVSKYLPNSFDQNQYFKRTFVLWCRFLQKKAYIFWFVHEPYICLFRLKLLFSDLSLLQFPEVDAVSVLGVCEARELMQKTQLMGKVECWGCGLGSIRWTERDLNNKRL